MKGEVFLAKRKSSFICQECGYESPKWMGKCPNCNQWNSLVEEVVVKTKSSHSGLGQDHSQSYEQITSIETKDEARIKTDMPELNRVLGGGIVSGSLVLIGGDPGIGKSTLLLQISNKLANRGLAVLYISEEESVRQTKLRADRIGVTSDELCDLSEKMG